MIISDLNYLETATQTTVIGGGKFYNKFNFEKKIDTQVNTDLNFDFDVDVNEYFNKKANIKVYSDVEGNSSTFAFDNEAIGPNSSTEGTFNQLAVAGEGSSQNGLFVAAANY